MIRSNPFVAAVTTASLLSATPTLEAQTTGTIDVGGTWVQYEGYLGSGAASVSPTLRHDTPNVSLGISGNYIVFESGNHIMQGLAAAAWRTNIARQLRGEISGSSGLNVYEGSDGYGHLLGRTRLHYSGRLSGAWLGIATGKSYRESSDFTPYEVELGGWVVHEGVALGAIATRTWTADVEYFDVVGTARWRDPFFKIDASLGMRGWSDGGGQGVYGELHAQIPITGRLSALVSGGRYPSDHVRGAISSNFVSASLRVATSSSRTRPPAPQLRALFSELERPGKPSAGEARLTVRASLEDLHTIRIEAPDAERVELTADFTDWQPTTLRHRGNGVWEVTVRITSGVHRVNVRLNGGAWIVPRGLRAEEDDFGGRVGVLVVS